MKHLTLLVAVATLSVAATVAAAQMQTPAKSKSAQSSQTMTHSSQMTTERHTLTLNASFTANGKTLLPGDYTVVISGDHASLMKGTENVLTNISVETNSSKFDKTSVKSSKASMAGNRPALKEIDLGRTSKKLIFS